MDQPRISTNPIALALDREWDRYAHRTLTLDGETLTATDALERIRMLAGDAQNEFLLQLLEQTQTGGELAGKVLLKTMLAKAVRISRSATAVRRLPAPDAVACAVAAMYQAIAEYPTARWRRSVAANISFLALRILNAEAAGHEEITGFEEFELQFLAEQHSAPVDDHPFRAVVRVLSWALDTNVLTSDEVKILANYKLGDQRERAELVERLGTTREALRKRALRIGTKLGDAIAESGLQR